VSTPSGLLVVARCSLAACSLIPSHTSGCEESQRAPATSSGSAHFAVFTAALVLDGLRDSFFPAMTPRSHGPSPAEGRREPGRPPPGARPGCAAGPGRTPGPQVTRAPAQPVRRSRRERLELLPQRLGQAAAEGLGEVVVVAEHHGVPDNLRA